MPGRLELRRSGLGREHYWLVTMKFDTPDEETLLETFPERRLLGRPVGKGMHHLPMIAIARVPN